MACCIEGSGNPTILKELKDLVGQIGEAGCCQKQCCPPNSCGDSTILKELKDLVNQVGTGCCDKKLCPPSNDCCGPCVCAPMVGFPFAQVTMTIPPPILVPIRPEPVKPLQLPCPYKCPEPPMSHEDRDKFRYDNFYNNYNCDSRRPKCECLCPQPPKCKKPCEDYTKNPNQDDCPLPGCPTGFKPCTMKLTPPPCCDAYLPWCAQVQPCPPKPKKKSNKYEPGPCTRPCCKHWKPNEGPCLYDDPCKAHCFNHPPGMKPSGRFP